MLTRATGTSSAPRVTPASWLRGLLVLPGAVLHRVHSGHVGDYAAALVLGVAAFAGVVTGA